MATVELVQRSLTSISSSLLPYDYRQSLLLGILGAGLSWRGRLLLELKCLGADVVGADAADVFIGVFA